MNTRNIVIAVVVVIVLAIIGLVVWGETGPATSGTAATTTPSTSGTTSNTSASSGFKSLGDVVAQGGNYQCTISIIDANSRTTGTVYGTAGKTRLDLTVAAENGTSVITHIIRSGTTSYTWVDGQQTGVKTTITPGSPVVAQPNGGVSSSTGTGANAAQFSSNCYPNVPTASNFVPPTGITFIAR